MDKIKDFADEHTYQTYILPNLLLKAGGVGGGGCYKNGYTISYQGVHIEFT